MKSISLALITLLTISSHGTFAESNNNKELCCPVSTASTSNQQVILDQIQAESEQITNHSSIAFHTMAKKRISETTARETMMLDSIQKESQSVTVDALSGLSLKAAEHVNKQTASVR